MKTVLYIDKLNRPMVVNGHKIVTGFGDPVIDPHATRAKVDKLLPKTGEFKEAEELKKEHARLYNLAMETFKEGAVLLRKRKKAESDIKAAEYRKVYKEAEDCQKKLQDKVPVIKALKMKLTLEHAVYFEPKPGEVIISDDEFLKLFDKLKNRKPDQLVTIDGHLIKNPDYVSPEEQKKKLAEEANSRKPEDIVSTAKGALRKKPKQEKAK